MAEERRSGVFSIVALSDDTAPSYDKAMPRLSTHLESAEVDKERPAQAAGAVVAAKPEHPIPHVASGYEAEFRRFLGGRLIYQPNPDNEEGMIALPIAELANPLEGTFDLSGCGDTGRYLSISTGYRKGKKPAKASQVEIWLVPRVLAATELGTTAAHLAPIMDDWLPENEVGLIWTWGGWTDMGYYDYLTTQSCDTLSNGENFYEKLQSSHPTKLHTVRNKRLPRGARKSMSCFSFELFATDK